jgi:hypothetical protein
MSLEEIAVARMGADHEINFRPAALLASTRNDDGGFSLDLEHVR